MAFASYVIFKYIVPSMSKSLKKNYISAVLNQVLSAVIQTVALFYISRALAAPEIGEYSYAVSVCSYFILLSNLGFVAYGQREIAFLRDDKDAYSKVFAELFCLKLIISAVVMSAYAAFIFLFAKDKLLYTIIIIQIVNSMLDISWLYTGLEKFGTVMIRTLVIRIIYFIATILFVKGPEDFYIYAAIESMNLLGVSLSLFMGLRKLVRKPSGKLDIWRHFIPVLSLFVPSVAVQIYTILDKSMLGIFSGGVYTENGYYELSQNFVKGSLLLVTTLANVSAPRIAYELARNNMQTVKKQMYDSYRFAWFSVIPIIIVIYFIAPRVVPLFYGPGYDKVIVLVRVLLPLLMAMGLSTISGSQFLVPARKVRYYNISLAIGAAVNFILNFMLIPHLQSVGASIGSVAAEFSVLLTQLVFISHLGILKIRRILGYGMKYILAGLMTSAFLIYMDDFIPFSVLGIFEDIIIGLAVYLAILFILRDRLMIDSVRKLFRRSGSLHKEDGNGKA